MMDSKDKIDLNVLKRAYGFDISEDGEIFALTAGDQHYESTGIWIDGVTLDIWKLGWKAWEKKEKLCTPKISKTQKKRHS